MLYLFSAFLLAWMSSCAPVDRGQLTKEVLAKDPSFEQVLDKRKELTSRVQTLERELALKRETVDKNITQLRKDLATAASNVRIKTAEIKKRMDPDQKRLEEELASISQELRSSQEKRAALGRQMAQLKKNLSPKASLTAEERAKQEASLNEMVADSQTLDQEMQAIKERVRIVKIKLLLVKF